VLEAINPKMENLKHQLLIKTNEFDLLRQEMVERSKSKFNEIDALKKQLAEAERNLAKYVEGQSLLNDTTSSISEDDKQSIGGKLEQIERMVRETRSEMKEYMSKSMIVSTTPSEVASSTMSSNDSRHMLDDRVIHSHLVLNQPDSDDIPSATSCSVNREASPVKKKFNQVIEGFKQIEDAPQIYRVDQKINFSQLDHPCRSSSSTPEMSALSPTIIENSIRNPLQRAQDTLSQFLPQLPGFSQSAPIKIVEEYHDRATTPIREQPRCEMPEPLVPEIVNSPINVCLGQEVASSDFSDLVNWARGNIASCNASLEQENVVEQIHNNIVFTDDGRTLTKEESRMESRLKCPICEETFDEDDVRDLEIHVDHHLATSLICPVCNVSFGMTNREAFERHVQEHFDNEEDTRGDFTSTRGNWSFLDFE
jgi:hypothetical protein